MSEKKEIICVVSEYRVEIEYLDDSSGYLKVSVLDELGDLIDFIEVFNELNQNKNE